MSISDGITYLIAILLTVYFIHKFSWLDDFIESNTVIRSIAKIAVIFIVVYLFICSILNWCFYANLYILMNSPFNYGFFKSFHIAITLTNEYSSMGYYMEWAYHKIIGDNNFDMMNQLVDNINNMMGNMGNVSSDQSSLSTLQDILHLFY